MRKSLPEPDSKLEFEPAIPVENKSPKPAKEERKISESARKIETIKTHDNSAAKQVGAQNTHSSSSEIAIPQEASVWFSLASWARENKYFDGRCRQFIFKVGLYYKKGWPLSLKNDPMG